MSMHVDLGLSGVEEERETQIGGSIKRSASSSILIGSTLLGKDYGLGLLAESGSGVGFAVCRMLISSQKKPRLRATATQTKQPWLGLTVQCCSQICCCLFRSWGPLYRNSISPQGQIVLAYQERFMQEDNKKSVLWHLSST